MKTILFRWLIYLKKNDLIDFDRHHLHPHQYWQLLNYCLKKLLLIVFSLSFLSSCSNDKDFFLTKENALISCGGKSRIIENENEEIINTEVKDLIDGIGKYVEFTVVETDKKGGKYRIINCFPSEEPQDSIIKTIKTNYKLNN